MDFSQYQKEAKKTAVFPADQALPYLALGLAGEAAEAANKTKKILRGDYDNDPTAAENALESIGYELGDVLWYIAVFADELGVSLDDLARANVDKLRKRAELGTIRGSGDDR